MDTPLSLDKVRAPPKSICVFQQERSIFPGFEGLPFISAYTYRKLRSAKSNFGREVSASAFDYYAAVISTAKIIKTQIHNGFTVLKEEKNMCNEIESLSLKPPAPIATYLNALDNVAVRDGVEYKISRQELQYEKGDNGIPGYFGPVNEFTHWQYAAYPCLAVYAQRIKQDILATKRKDLRMWDLPNNIRPEKDSAGSPTKNMLGWKPADYLGYPELDFLIENGYDVNGDYNYTNDVIPFNFRLILSIQKKLNALEIEKLPINFHRSQGSKVLLATTEATNENLVGIVLQGSLKIASPVRLDPQSLAAVYRINRIPENSNWCIYKWERFLNVPETWRETCNELRQREQGISTCDDFVYIPHSLEFLVNIFVDPYFHQHVDDSHICSALRRHRF